MSDIKIQPSATGSATVTLTAPATSTARTVTLPDGTGTLIADNGSGSVGIGETTPLAKLHIKRGDSGLSSLNAAGDHIFLENTGANGTGITLASGNTANGSIIFGDQDSNYRGVLIYDHSLDAMKIVTAGTERMRIDSSGNVAIGHTTTTGSKFAICDGANSQIQFFPEISTDTNLTQHYDPTATAYINAETRAASHSFKIGTTERTSIDTNGLSIGTYANPPSSGSFIRLHPLGIIQSGRTGTANQPAIEFFNGNGVVGSIYTGGTTTTYYTSSDYRLKENVNYDWDATTRLKQLKPARFNFTADDSVTVDGFLAHEVSSIVPEAIGGEKDAVDDDGNAVHQGIDQSKLVPLLVKTIQELEARITAGGL